MTYKTDLNSVRSRIRYLHLGIAVGFLLVGFALTYWTVLRGPQILQREDNPRLVEEELRIQRGRIFDRQNVILAETTGEDGDLRRVYPVPEARHVTGYYSFRYGTSGIESAFDELLRGDSDNFWEQFWRYDTLHEIQEGQDVRLTVDAQLQKEADRLMDGNKGAIVLIDVTEGVVKALVSHPGFDPNQLEDQFEQLTSSEDAPLLNRVTQGQYQPGLVLQPFLIASALDEGLITLEEPIDDVDQPVLINGDEILCAEPDVSDSNWLQGLQARCPYPMLLLADKLGNEGLNSIFEKYGFYNSPTVEVETGEPSGESIQDPSLAAIGQDTLSISPLQLVIALSSLANGGNQAQLSFVDAIRGSNGEWLPFERPEDDQQIIQKSAAERILASMPRHQGYAEYSVPVLSGPEGTINTWYLGLTPANAPEYAVVVVLEDNPTLTRVEQIGRSMLGFIGD